MKFSHHPRLPGLVRFLNVISAIQAAAGFVFLIRPPGPGDRWQTFEWQQIVDREYYLDPSKRLIPVLIGDPEMPGFLKTPPSALSARDAQFMRASGRKTS
jgi:hypothetical protein